MAEKKIGQKTFKVEPMLATEAIRLQARLLKAVGAALDKLPEIFKGARLSVDKEGKPRQLTEQEQKVVDASNAAAITAFTDIFARADPDDIMALVKDVCEVAMVRRPSGAYDPVSFDGDFTGNLGEIVPVAVFVLQEQFGDFFGGVLQSGKAAVRKDAH